MPRCICQCQREAEEQRKTAEERQRRMERIKRRKAQGLQDRYPKNTFFLSLYYHQLFIDIHELS